MDIAETLIGILGVFIEAALETDSHPVEREALASGTHSGCTEWFVMGDFAETTVDGEHSSLRTVRPGISGLYNRALTIG